MTALERIGIEIAAALLLAGGVVFWWHRHNAAEQLQGAQVCVQKYTITQQQGAADTSAAELDHARILSTAVATYDQKIRDLNSANADLLQRLHQYNAAPGGRALPAMAGSAGSIPACQANAADGPSDREREEADTLAACAANAVELDSLREAWIAQAKKRAPVRAP